MAANAFIESPEPRSDHTDRRTARCEDCGDIRELATATECFRYRARKRAEAPYPSSPGERRQQKRLWRVYSSVVAAMHDMNLPEAEIQKHVDMLRPWLGPIKDRLPGTPPETRKVAGNDVNEFP